MKCPHCQTESKSLVKETRLQFGELARRRECTGCGAMFVTREIYDPEYRILKKPTGPKPRVRTNNDDLFKVWSKA
jgi:transcriptional regulator NrdR family protein